MEAKKSINIISLLLIIIAIVMIYLGLSAGMLPPTLTGIGFLLISWALQLLKRVKP